MSIISCNNYPKDVSVALSMAGDNRQELEGVLNLYKKTDALKYEAACYLIANMPYHGSLNEITLDKKYDVYFRKVDSIYNLFFGDMTLSEVKNLRFRIPDSVRNALSEEFDYIPYPIYSEGKSDIKNVSSDFLIDNIEMAFYVWRTIPILENMDFEEFKEFILPYRVSDECLLYKRSELYDRYFCRLAKDGMNNIYIPIEWYKLYTLKQERISYYTNRTNNIGLYDLFLPASEFNCHNQVTWTCNMFRACGIPVTYEFTPQWPDRENRHFWCVSPDTSGIYTPYSIPQNNIGEDWESNLRFAAKVYRRGFAVNKNNACFLRTKDEYIPEIFNLPTLKDESFRYRQTVSLELPFQVKTSNKLAFLSIVTRSGLVPVGWGKIDRKKKSVSFEQVPVDIVFILSYYEKDKLQTIGFPFLLQSDGELSYIQKPLTSNTINRKNTLSIEQERQITNKTLNDDYSNLKYRELKVDSTVKISMHLLRKYPKKLNLQRINTRFAGSILLASNYKGSKFDTIHVFQKALKPNLQQIDLNNKQSYRYYKIETPDKSPVNIAHIEFLGEQRNQHQWERPTPLPVFYEESTVKEPESLFKIIGLPADDCMHAFDDNLETFVNVSSIRIEFQNPVKIKAVRIAPRNANNQIVVGDNYSLAYFDGQDWKEVFKTRATGNYIKAENIPAGGLYLLRNLDNGKEEMPFLYEENTQKWLR